MANGYTHAKCYYTARQIWTKDVGKRAILRTDVLSHQMSSLLPPKSPQTPILGDLSMQSLLYTELSRKSHVNGAMKLKRCSYIGIGKYLEEWGVSNFFPLGGVQGAQGTLMQIWDPHIISETSGTRKLKLKTQLDLVNYSLWVQ